MKWIIGIAAFIVVLVLVVVGIGAMLPQSHTASRMAHINAAPDGVWAVLTDPAAFPKWRGDVQSVEILTSAGGPPRWREVSKHGAVTYEIAASTPNRSFTTRIMDRDLPYGGSWVYELADASPGTDLTITEHGEVYNPVYRFVSRFVMGHTATIDAFLKALAVKFDGGTTPPTLSG